MFFIAFVLFIAFIVVDYFLFRLFFRSIFEDAEHFWECLKLDFRPDIFSFFKGELTKDWAAEFRIGMFFFMCVIVLVVEFFVIRGIMLL